MRKTVRIARTTDVNTLDPLRYNDKGTGEVLNRMYSHLVVTDDAGEYAWGTIVADAQRRQMGDRIRYAIRLRGDARWHDGEPVTAADVIFTISRALDPDLDSPRRPELLACGADLTVDADDTHTVRIEFTPTGRAGLRALAWLPVLPRHHHWPDGTGTQGWTPIGSGEFRFRTYDPADGTVTLDANQAHWAPPKIDVAHWRRFPDSASAVDSVLRGDSDIATSVPPALATAVVDHPGVRVHLSSDGSCTYLGYNTGTGLLRDRDIRVALASAIDRQRLVDTVLGGQGVPAKTMIHPQSSWHCPDVVEHRYDPRSASELLDRNGWRLDSSRIRRDANGNPLSVSLLTVAGDDVKQQTARLVAQQLAEVGVEVRVVSVSIADLLHQHVYPRRYEIVLLAFNPGPSPSFLRAFYHSGADGGQGNRFGYANPVVDKMIDELPPLDEEESARSAVLEIQRQVARDVPHTPLFHPNVVDIASAALLLPKLSGLYTNRFSDLHRWDLTATSDEFGGLHD